MVRAVTACLFCLCVTWTLQAAGEGAQSATLLCHTIDEMLSADKVLELEFGYAAAAASAGSPRSRACWPRLTGIFLESPERRRLWIESDRAHAIGRLDEILASPSAWSTYVVFPPVRARGVCVRGGAPQLPAQSTTAPRAPREPAALRSGRDSARSIALPRRT